MLRSRNFPQDCAILFGWTFFVWLMFVLFAPYYLAFPTGMVIFTGTLYVLVKRLFSRRSRSYFDTIVDMQSINKEQ